MKLPYGYNDDGTINPAGAEKVQSLFQKVNEYSENPPTDLVEMTREEMEVRTGKKVTYEEAKKHVPYSQIKEYVCKELSQ